MKHKLLTALTASIVMIFLLHSSAIGLNAAPAPTDESEQAYEEAKKDAMGICPPFYLRDKEGNIINPLENRNADVPYSPKKTCGKCHDYKKITKGYHFQQGKLSEMSHAFQETYPWCTSPGQYGGRW
ncbi:MAG: hypothetical protein U5L07_09485 [Desulfobacterales bacterium]|nr:hypothetical protein [Desulfobacterales bacterium]